MSAISISIAKEIYNDISVIRRNDRFDEMQCQKFVDIASPIIDEAISSQREVIERYRVENERLRERCTELVEQADDAYAPYREMVAEARAETNKFSAQVQTLREALENMVMTTAGFMRDWDDDAENWKLLNRIKEALEKSTRALEATK